MSNHQVDTSNLAHGLSPSHHILHQQQNLPGASSIQNNPHAATGIYHQGWNGQPSWIVGVPMMRANECISVNTEYHHMRGNVRIQNIFIFFMVLLYPIPTIRSYSENSHLSALFPFIYLYNNVACSFYSRDRWL